MRPKKAFLFASLALGVMGCQRVFADGTPPPATRLTLQVQPVWYYRSQRQIVEGKAPKRSYHGGLLHLRTETGLRVTVSLIGTRRVERLLPQAAGLPRAPSAHRTPEDDLLSSAFLRPNLDAPSSDFVQVIDKFYLPLSSEPGALPVGPYSYRVDGTVYTAPAVVLHSVRVNDRTLYYLCSDHFRVGQPAFVAATLLGQHYFPNGMAFTVANTAVPTEEAGVSDSFFFGVFTPTQPGPIKVKMLVGTEFGSFPVGEVP